VFAFCFSSFWLGQVAARLRNRPPPLPPASRLAEEYPSLCRRPLFLLSSSSLPISRFPSPYFTIPFTPLFFFREYLASWSCFPLLCFSPLGGRNYFVVPTLQAFVFSPSLFFLLEFICSPFLFWHEGFFPFAILSFRWGHCPGGRLPVFRPWGGTWLSFNVSFFLLTQETTFRFPRGRDVFRLSPFGSTGSPLGFELALLALAGH